MLSNKFGPQVWVREWTGGAVKQSPARLPKTVQILYLRYTRQTSVLSGTGLCLTASSRNELLLLVLLLAVRLSAWLH